MTEPIIEIRNIGKRYRITRQRGRYITLRDSLASAAKRPFAFLQRSRKEPTGTKREDFWALRNVSATITKGDIVGVIGHNGAGKSTLLKILTGITPPTEGEVIMRGRTASLLEVGTGFHPELTGRENIFLNGAILGMTRKELERKFDEIVAFAGIEKFLDTPVKYYSSGMYVRLAFSVAAHMEPDILLIDEVLAVGDAEFQKKCLGKMEEVTQKEGRTIIFVSHNMSAIRNLCRTSILLNHGEVVAAGPTEEVITAYEGLAQPQQDPDRIRRRGDGRLRITGFRFEDVAGNQVRTLKDKDVVLVLSYECSDSDSLENVDVAFSFYKNGALLGSMYSSYTDTLFGNLAATGEFRFSFSTLPLSSGRYDLGTRVLANGIELDCPHEPIGSFEVNRDGTYIHHDLATEQRSSVLIEGSWER